ncbi:MAG: amidotransferase [Deltaproteobacteria bacterium HGW-Deltaproteobacteria-12]|jgi:GMP synthase-like glutamine amidotransferase|nr:MAG: amidotransferase [Deltaproteobacteria bacterium HGW-Deltaproteobacteria-12]
MRAHYLQHVPFEGLGSIEAWLQTAGYEITSTQFYKSADLPKVEEIDLLVVMGGPMSVNDENDHPWLADEKNFIRKFIESGKPTLGICLGAQLIANSMGGKVFKNPVKEIGWYPVQAITSLSNTIFRFPEEMIVFHWHGETFTLPPQAIPTAESEGCKNQAFQIGNNVIGLQFHLETTPDSAQALVENCRNELVEGKYIQTEQQIISVTQERYKTINSLMVDILEYLHNEG